MMILEITQADNPTDHKTYWVQFSKDVETLKLYIELEELRHENKFSPIFKIDPLTIKINYYEAKN